MLRRLEVVTHIDENGVLTDIDKTCDSYHDTVLAPYVWIIISTIIFDIIKRVSGCLGSILRVYFKKYYIAPEKKEKVDPSSSSDAFDDFDSSKSLKRKSIHEDQQIDLGIFGFIQTLIMIGIYALTIYDVDSAEMVPDSGWTRYNIFCFTIANSSIPTALVSVFVDQFYEKHEDDEKRKSMSVGIRLMKYVGVLLFLPILITHGVVGFVIFDLFYILCILGVGMTLFLLPVFVLPYFIENWCGRKLSDFYTHTILPFFYILFLKVALYILISSTINCMVFLYTYYPAVIGVGHSSYHDMTYYPTLSSQQYMDIFYREFVLRIQTKCFFRHDIDKIRNAVVVFSWI